MLHLLSHPRPQEWRQRLLTKLGTRMHTTSMERGDNCSIAILDARGVVVAWHDSLPGARRFDFGVVGIHVSQFYLSHDVVFQQPSRRLIAAGLHGADTQERWHRRPDGSIFWAVTVIEARRLKSGELNGYSHVTRHLQERGERTMVTPRRVPRSPSVCYGATAAA